MIWWSQAWTRPGPFAFEGRHLSFRICECLAAALSAAASADLVPLDRQHRDDRMGEPSRRAAMSMCRITARSPRWCAISTSIARRPSGCTAIPRARSRSAGRRRSMSPTPTSRRARRGAAAYRDAVQQVPDACRSSSCSRRAISRSRAGSRTCAPHKRTRHGRRADDRSADRARHHPVRQPRHGAPPAGRQPPRAGLPEFPRPAAVRDLAARSHRAEYPALRGRGDAGAAGAHRQGICRHGTGGRAIDEEDVDAHPDLTGTTVIVTGAAGGLGSMMALSLAARGRQCRRLRSAEAPKHRMDELLAARGARATAARIHAVLVRRDAIRPRAKQRGRRRGARNSGAIHGLVNCAGLGPQDLTSPAIRASASNSSRSSLECGAAASTPTSPAPSSWPARWCRASSPSEARQDRQRHHQLSHHGGEPGFALWASPRPGSRRRR